MRTLAALAIIAARDNGSQATAPSRSCFIAVVARAKALWPEHQTPIRMFAQPRKKLPERSVKVMCSGCRAQLYRYKKGGKGSLVKCFVERIAEDFTTAECVCPQCAVQFARPCMIRGTKAYKIIGGKAFQK